MPDNFTDASKMALKHARAEAERMGHDSVGEGHLLLGLLMEGGVAAAALRRVGLDLGSARPVVEKAIESASDLGLGGGNYALTPRAKKSLELAVQASLKRGAGCVGTEHLLLGLTQHADGFAAQVLVALGIELERIPEIVDDLQAAAPAPAADPPAQQEPAPQRPSQAGTYELAMEATFAAAHNLREYEGECERLHGHNWRVEVRVGAAELDELGMVMDFRDLKAALGRVLDRLDHSYLNEAPPFDTVNPTTENLCRHVAERLRDGLPGRISIRRVTCWESEGCSATYAP